MKAFVDGVTKNVSADGISEHPPPCPGVANGAGAEDVCPTCPVLMRKEAVNDTKRGFIMDAALRVIARDGYANARLEDIAKEAGFSKASIYHYFSDKEALLIYMTIREQQLIHEKYMEIVDRDLSFLETIKEFVHVFYDRTFGGGSIYSAFTSSLSIMGAMSAATKHEELLKMSIARKKETFDLMVQVIAKAQKDGTLTVPLDDETICIMIATFLQMSVYKNMLVEEPWDGVAEKIDTNKVVESLFIFFKPWINEKPSHNRE
ncbi:MAG: TetR/AcrR family transcriptional regulator [Chitinispirillales bacterium]|jgi:AcrR family transcriptional regulator|nr:TetR/AcrR family transcriptional regulator [Chitinispirillales bacterium]